MFKAADMKSFLAGFVKDPGAQNGCKSIQSLATDDFIKASNYSDEFYTDLAKLVKILSEKERKCTKLIFQMDGIENVTLVCDDDHPFFVFCSGWSSLSPLLTKVKYNVSCRLLSVGDICLVLRNRKKRKRADDEDTCGEIREDLVARDDVDSTGVDNNQPIDLSKKQKL